MQTMFQNSGEKSVFKNFLIVAAAASLAVLALVPVSTARELYVVDGQSVMLVSPDGEVLDGVPEQGSVDVRRDQFGRRVLIDRYGNVVAIEVPARRLDRQQRDERGWGYGDAPWDPPADRGDWRDDSGEITGALPDGRYPAPPSVESQPLPGLPHDRRSVDRTNVPGDEEASLGTDDSGRESLRPAPGHRPSGISMAGTSRAEVAALQVYLDREGMSPGVIDGKMGGNVEKALRAYEATTGDKLDPRDSEAVMQRLATDGGLPFQQYRITAADAAGPYVASIPSDYSQKAEMPSLGYTSTAEMLAERFHMDEDYLKSLNPGVDFSVPGTIIKVVNPGKDKTGTVTRIVANKSIKEVQAFDANGNLVAAYPATIGSADTPSPSGTHTVTRIAFNPNYTYNPKINFRQGNNDKVLTIPPGPNGPVGNVWIALSKPTYGIHGTPDPDKIGKTASHGCVRLTNWDANELARMVKPGTIVQFVD